MTTGVIAAGAFWLLCVQADDSLGLAARAPTAQQAQRGERLATAPTRGAAPPLPAPSVIAPRQSSIPPTDAQVEITEEEEAVLALYDEMADAFAERDNCEDMVEGVDTAVAAREPDIRHLLALADQRQFVPMERRQALSAEVLERMARFDVHLKRAMSACSSQLLPALAQLSAITPRGVH